ncbi:MAG TPA: nuclear transport factor 2 family protein [Silvibacterium sp.]|nr:nuclear transport factor 2 family protein [Silvibacterium sp.]
MNTATLNPSAADQITQDQTAILSLLEETSKAHRNKNARGIAALYTRDADIFNLAPPLVHRGIDLSEKQAWLDSWEGPVTIEPRDFQITVSGNSAFAHGYMRLSGKKKGADQPVDFWMRETLCLERVSGDWRIVHEHSSVPFYMDGSLRPAFDLRP